MIVGEIIIRKAFEKDISGILLLLYDLGRPKPQNNSDEEKFENLIIQYLVESDKQILVAIDDMNLVGMMSMMFLPRLNRTRFEMYVPELIVHENHQNLGIGKKLLNFGIDLAKEKQCHRIRLESGNSRKESHQFYKHLGFEQSAYSFVMNLE